jgi:hypothetical protein
MRDFALQKEDVLAHIDHAATEVTALGARPDAPREQLKIGIAEVAMFLAAKIVVPVIASYVSRALYERFGYMRSRSDVNKAVAALQGSSVSSSPAVDRESVVKAVVDSLVDDEGLRREDAEELVAKVYERVAAEVGSVKRS